MRDGGVRTWMNLQNPMSFAPRDPLIRKTACCGLLGVRSADGAPRGIISNFALHLDTVGGAGASARLTHR